MYVATIPVAEHAEQVSHRGSAYRADIDGLRAIAIISVVAFHTRLPFFGGGFVGVDVFFVISGYLISSLVYREVSEFRFSFLRFYERRTKRILPALLTVLTVCGAIAYVLLSPLELRDYCAQAVAAVASGSNVFYWLRSNYFNPATALKPLLMTWSLGVEEQFYLLFPLLLVFLHKFSKRRIFQVAVAACVLSFTFSVLCLRMYPSAAFYLLPMRAWELGLGVLLAIYEVNRSHALRLGTGSADILGWFGLALIVGPVLTYTEATPFPGFAAILPTVGTAFLISTRNSVVNRRLLSWRPLVFVGLASYSWYLWHWPLMSFARIVSGGLIPTGRMVLIAFFSLALAVVSYRIIEQPFRKSTVPRVQLFAGYATAMVLLGAVSLVGYMRSGWPDRVPGLLKAEAAVRKVEENTCLAGFDDSTPLLKPPCVSEGAGPKLALLGDSHAASLSVAMVQLATEHGYGFEQITKTSCPPLSTSTRQWALHPTLGRTCAAFNHAAFQHVLNDPSVTVVVLVGFWSSLSSDGKQESSPQPGTVLAKETSDHNLYSDLLATIQLFRSAGKHVFVVTDVPRFPVNPMSAVRNSVMKPRAELASLLSSQALSLNPVDESSLVKPADAVANNQVRQAALEGGAQTIEPDRNLCPQSRCRFWDNGVLLYSDPHHLTPAGAELALRGQDPIARIN